MSETFEQLGVSSALVEALTELGYETPSPIQAACIPALLSGRDILGQAQTGTGKTAAFALPLLQRLELENKKPQILVLAPTRELAIQVAESCQSYARHLPGFRIAPIYGGQAMGLQFKQLQRGVHVVVGTPGRVMDHMERKSLDLSEIKAVVLDEADEMLRMGFIDDVEWILQRVPADRQTALFSATMPPQIHRVATRYLHDPLEARIESKTTTVTTIRQRYWQVSGIHKLDALTRILEVEDNLDAVIIFVRTKTETVELAEKLEARGYEAAALNGDMNQQLRERTIEQLKNGGIDIVIATDVAARGIDVPRISHVINYDIPYDTEAYVHRIGRTGRAGRTGNAILFVAPRETRMLRAIERATRQPIEPLSLPTKKTVSDRRIAQFKERILEVIESEELDDLMALIDGFAAEADISANEVAAALAFMVQEERPLNAEGIHDVPLQPARRESKFDDRREGKFNKKRGEWKDDFRDKRERGERGERNERRSYERNDRDERGDRRGGDRFGKGERRDERGGERRERGGRYQDERHVGGEQRVYKIGIGRAQGVTPSDIVGAVANETGIKSRAIGRIQLFDDHGTIELPASLSAETKNALKFIRIRQHSLKISL